MNVASLSLSKELYALSGWNDTQRRHPSSRDKREDWPPAYDLGFLLRKLPKSFDGYYFDLSVTSDGAWTAEYFTNDYTPERPISKYEIEAVEPEDAIAQLLITLFRDEVITREVTS